VAEKREDEPMSFDLKEYTIRRKVFKFLGAAFHLIDTSGAVVGYSKQKAFKLREDIRIYSDETMAEELLVIKARQIIDFSAAYDFVDSRESRKVGAARRKGFASILRDSWEILDEEDRPVASVTEDSMALALVRRFLVNLIPQGFSVVSTDGRKEAEYRQRFNPFVFKLDVRVAPGSKLDPRLVLGTAVLVAAIEQRQQ
jgi:hypothetical protein